MMPACRSPQRSSAGACGPLRPEVRAPRRSNASVKCEKQECSRRYVLHTLLAMIPLRRVSGGIIVRRAEDQAVCIKFEQIMSNERIK